MQGLLTPDAVSSMPAVADWLQLASPSVQRARASVPSASGDSLLQTVIEQNVLLQVEHLQTYPFVQEAAAAGRLRLHAWTYLFESGEVIVYDPGRNRFVPLGDSPRQKLLVPMPAAMPPMEHRGM